MNNADLKRVERLQADFAGPHRFKTSKRPRMTGAERWSAMERIAATLRLPPGDVDRMRGKVAQGVMS